MSDKYRLSIQVDEARKTIIARAVGPMPSRELTEAFLAAYRRIDKSWQYNRVIVYRKFTGSIDFTDAEDFARQWIEMIGDEPYGAKVAFVSDDALEHARSGSYDGLTHDRIKTFKTIDEVLDWLAQ